MRKGITVLFGAEVATRVRQQQEAEVRQTPGGYFESDALCAFQRKMHSAGYVEAEICATIHGYSLRYATGLMGFSIIQSCRGDNAYERCLDAAREWQAGDPHRRSVFIRDGERELRAKLEHNRLRHSGA